MRSRAIGHANEPGGGEVQVVDDGLDVVERVYNIRAVGHQDHLAAVGHRYTGLPGDFHRDVVPTRGVVVDEVQLLVGGDKQVAVRSQRPGAFDEHIAGDTRGTVGDRDGGVCAIGNGLGYVPGDGLLNEGPKVGVGRRTPCARLVAGTDEFNAQVGRVGRRHIWAF